MPQHPYQGDWALPCGCAPPLVAMAPAAAIAPMRAKAFAMRFMCASAGVPIIAPFCHRRTAAAQPRQPIDLD